MLQNEKLIDWDELFHLFDYDKDTGIFIYKERRGSKPIGSIAGGVAKDGYIRININGIKFYAHRLAWFYEYGRWPNGEIDHIDRIKSNNIIINLREATKGQNMANVVRSKAKHKSPYIGVTKVVNRYRTRIVDGGIKYNLGTYDTQEQAALAYNDGALALRGEFAILNRIPSI